MRILTISDILIPVSQVVLEMNLSRQRVNLLLRNHNLQTVSISPHRKAITEDTFAKLKALPRINGRPKLNKIKPPPKKRGRPKKEK